MFQLKCAIVGLGLFALSVAARAVDYSEEEPNDQFPPTFLTGNPVFNMGDRFVGNISSGIDEDIALIRTAGTGTPGIYRYTFDLNANGGDSGFNLLDNSADNFTIGTNDDFPGQGSSSRILFDHFDTTGGIQTWGLDIFNVGTTSFNYQMEVTRTLVTPDDLGSISSGTTSRTFTPAQGGANWVKFTLASASSVSLDTLNSASGSDTEIALFDANGNTIGGNDDLDTSTLESGLSRNLDAGTYYASVGVYNSLYNWDNDSNTQLGWDRNGFSGGTDNAGIPQLGINVTVAPVPEPASMSAILLGIGALVARRRRGA